MDIEPQLEPCPQRAEKGALYLVGTPIGNVWDLSLRAAAILASCDTLACEDTRVTGQLLKRLGIQRPMFSYREENEAEAAKKIIDLMQSGQALALVSDAGMPTVSDPGFRVVRMCRQEGLPVYVVPGPSAAVSALAGSGLPTDRFLYAGFLAPKRAARKRFLEEHKDFESTIILYESCHRIAAFLEDIEAVLGPERVIAVAREITKLHETFYVGPASVVRENMQSKKGEFVVIIAKEGFVL